MGHNLTMRQDQLIIEEDISNNLTMRQDLTMRQELTMKQDLRIR